MGALLSPLEKSVKNIEVRQAFQKKRKSTKSTKWKQPSNSGSHFEIISSEPIFRFLFIGETGTGKSSMIANLFKFNATSCGPEHLQIWTQGSIEVIELPGLLQTDSLENNVSSLAAFVVFLREHFSQVIPTLIFVTARVSDNRFEGCSSNFSRVLQGVKLLLPPITDNYFSNVVLLLSSSEIDADELDFKIARYKLAFENIIPKKNVPCLTVSSKPPLEQFQKLLNEMNNDFSSIRDFIVYLQNLSQTSDRGTEKSRFIPIKTYRTEDFFTLERKIKECIVLDLFPDRDVLAEEGSEVGLMRESSSFQAQECFSFKLVLNIPDGHTLMVENTFILMANGQFKYVQDCRIGDKVASFYQRAGVITKINRITLDPDQVIYVTKYTIPERKEQNEFNSFRKSIKKHVDGLSTLTSGEGSGHYGYNKCSQTFIKDSRSSSEHPHFWVYDSKSGKFASRALKKKSPIQLQMPYQLYTVEINHGDGTLIADGIVLSCCNALPQQLCYTEES